MLDRFLSTEASKDLPVFVTSEDGKVLGTAIQAPVSPHCLYAYGTPRYFVYSYYSGSMSREEIYKHLRESYERSFNVKQMRKGL